MRPFARFRLAALGLVALAVLALPAAGRAAPPEEKFLVVRLDEVSVDAFWTDQCGFEVRHAVRGTFKLSFTADEEGNLISAIVRVQGIAHTLIGPTGATLAFRDTGVTHVTYNPDGSLTVAGGGILALRITVPGEGLVVANIGRMVSTVVFDENGEVIAEDVHFEAGPRQGDFGQAGLDAVCAALA
jgi:hypothetical protein